MHNPPPVSVYTKRRLGDHELATIAGALEHFVASLSIEQQLELMAAYNDEPLPLSPDDARAIGRELIAARKVQVCRSKRKLA